MKTVEIPIPRIRTGYYSKVADYVDSGYTLLSISRTTPNIQTANILQLTMLAPSEDLFKRVKSGEISWVDYEHEYRDQISKLDLERCIKLISAVTYAQGSNGVVLLCYEKDSMKCHRSILADVLNKLGILEEAVEEFNPND